jgi:outer membrane protein assembly factor BamB
LVSLLLASVVIADDPSKPDWPGFRGPKRDGLSPDTGLLTEWPEKGPPLVWKATGVGSGYSSVAVAGDRVYTLGNKGKSTHLVAIGRGDGKVIWSTNVGAEGGNLGCTPTVDGDRIYTIGQQGDLACVSADGEIKWRKHFKKDYGGSHGGWKYCESPLVDGDWLVCTPGGKGAVMVALDKMTGEEIWKCDAPLSTPQAGYSSIVITEVGGVRMYVQLTAAGIIGVETKTGKFLWKYEKLGNNTANIPTPIIVDREHVFVSAGYGKGGALLKLSVEDGKVTAREVYYNNKLRNKHGGHVLVDGLVFGDEDDRGSPVCADVHTGKVLWQRRSRGAGSGSAAVTYADGHLYFRYQNGVMTLVKAGRNGYEEVSTFKIPGGGGPSWAHPVVIGGRLYLRESDFVLCYDVTKK